MSTASLYCSGYVQRLRAGGIAPHALGSFGLDPRALRPVRLRWLKRLGQPNWNKSEAGAKIAAFLVREQGWFLDSVSSFPPAAAPVMDSRFRGNDGVGGVRSSFGGNDGGGGSELNQSLNVALSSMALSHRASSIHFYRSNGLKAGAETSPPILLAARVMPP